MNRDYRNVLVLWVCQASFGTGRWLLIATAPLVAYPIAPHKALATLPTALVVIGTALSAFLVSMLTRRTGRRAGFMIGALIATLSGIVCCAAVILQNFWLLAAGGLLFGIFASFAQLYRFAVADAAPDHFKSTAISLALAGGVVAGFAGPKLASVGESLFGILFLGVYLFMIGTAAISAFALLFLDVPNLSPKARSGPQRPLSEIVKQPVFVASALTATIAQAVMNFLMTATPIAMVFQCGFARSDAYDVIAWHIVGMFAPGFVTGWLIAKFGEVRIILAGILLEGLCIAVALSGIEVFDFWLAMVLLGVGWNFTFTAATKLTTTAYTPAEREKTQGMVNQIVYTVVALGALSSGAVIHFFGWTWVNIAAAPLLILAAGVTIWYAADARRTAAAGA